MTCFQIKFSFIGRMIVASGFPWSNGVHCEVIGKNQFFKRFYNYDLVTEHNQIQL